MTNRAFIALLPIFAALFPGGAFAQTPEENWLGALSIETGVVSASQARAAEMFGAAAEMRRPHIPGGNLRLEVGGWRADVLENGAPVARWDQAIGFGLMHAFGHGKGIGALTPSLGLGLGLHAIGREDAASGTDPIHSSRTIHPSIFLDGAIAIHLTRSELLSLEVGGRYAAIANAPSQALLRIGVRLHPNSSATPASGIIRGESAAPASAISKTGTADAPSARFHTDKTAESRAAAKAAKAAELNVSASEFAEATQLTREKSNEVKAAVRGFMRSDENAGAEVVAFTSANNLQDGSATLRAATVARVLASAGMRTDRLRIVVRVAPDSVVDTDSVRIRLTH